MKKLAIFCAAMMAATGVSAFAGCAEAKEQKVMNLSLNPEVEFVLDENDKVVSVNALNEEGNLIVSAEVFTGKTAEEAAKLLLYRIANPSECGYAVMVPTHFIFQGT